MAKHSGEETIIAHGVRVEGEFVSQGNIVIEGDVEGKIHAGGDLRVGEEAKITADVTAANAVIAGELRGNLHVAGRLELMASSKIIGDVSAEVLSVSAGAQVNGKVTMDGTAAEKAKKGKEEDGS
ncbi:polymer-forming cytoskeletal protein [Candidatus Uhrbacteria bacterium]|nr:polymer-forming cytoskeletal protein [Candidatus Uhrbacteria bacterium]